MTQTQLSITAATYLCSALFLLIVLLCTLHNRRHLPRMRLYNIILIENITMCVAGGAAYLHPEAVILFQISFLAYYCMLATYTRYIITVIRDHHPVTMTAFWVAVPLCLIAMVFFLLDRSSNGYLPGTLRGGSALYQISQYTGIVVIILDLFVLWRYRAYLEKRVYLMLSLLPVAPFVVSELTKLLTPIPLRVLCISAVNLLLHMQIYISDEHLLLQQEEQLSQSRLAIAVNQTRPHFIFNTLSTIYYLCEEDPEEAKEAVGSFASYLRTNLELIEREDIIPFSRELEHVRYYTELEKLRYGGRIDFRMDIGAEDFKVPVLSVQPLVENAVSHGIAPTGKEGTVTISSREEERFYVVTVSNDGLPYSPPDPDVERTDHISVGVRSVRERLEKNLGGTLDIRVGSDGIGAVAEIRIPRSVGTK